MTRQALTEAARTLWAEGLSHAAIGARLGVTKGTIVGISHRAGFEPRQLVVLHRTGERIGERKHPDGAPIMRKRKPLTEAQRLQKCAKAREQRRAKSVRVAIRGKREPVPMMSTRATTDACQWITSDGRLWVFCGGEVHRGPYCAEHAERAVERRVV